VTGVNQFDARVMPDGTNVVLFPGSVGLALLANDSRVRFDAAHFLPLLACAGRGVVMLRGGLGARRTSPVRVACQAGLDPGAAALLAFDLLGLPALPVAAGADVLQAVHGGAADAVFVSSETPSVQIQALLQAGLAPALSAGLPGGAGDAAGHAALAPHLLALLPADRVRADPLVAGWTALAAASVTGMVLAVPRLSPAGAIARWQAACGATGSDPGVTEAVQARGAQWLTGLAAGRTMAAMVAPDAAQTALRGWLAMRLNWQPG
jgi:hypothetical protein